MSEDLGPIVIDRHAFERLWPALGVWLALFLTAGDAWTVVRRQAALLLGKPAEAVIVSKSRERHQLHGRRRLARFAYQQDGRRVETREAVGSKGWDALSPGTRRPVHVWGGAAFLDDDLGYSRWKLGLFGVAFVGLWAWAAATYRFG